MISRASRRLFMLYALRKHAAPVQDMLAIFQTYIRPILEYSCAVWHPSLTNLQISQIEKIQKRTCRIILGNDYQDYESALRELNITSLANRREDLVLKFGQHVLNSERHRHLLPEERPNKYNLRHSSAFQEPLCKTNRYQNSTIPYITHKLNLNR